MYSQQLPAANVNRPQNTPTSMYQQYSNGSQTNTYPNQGQPYAPQTPNVAAPPSANQLKSHIHSTTSQAANHDYWQNAASPNYNSNFNSSHSPGQYSQNSSLSEPSKLNSNQVPNNEVPNSYYQQQPQQQQQQQQPPPPLPQHSSVPSPSVQASTNPLQHANQQNSQYQSLPPQQHQQPQQYVQQQPQHNVPYQQYQQPSLAQQQQNYSQAYGNSNINAPSYAHQPAAYGQPQANPNVDQLSQNFSSMTLNRGFNQALGYESINLLSERHIKARAKPVRSTSGDQTIRCTFSKVPESTSILQKSRLPFGLVLHPFKDQEIPIIQDRTIVRCRSCRTYINPYVRLLEQRRWQCNFCHRLNDLPDDFLVDPRSQQYIDYPMSQPELACSTVEFVASVDYMVRPPQAAAYLFVFDCSVHALALGYVPVMAKVILENLENIPGDTRTLVGFIGFDSNIHFFNLGEEQPMHMTVPDIEDAFIPSPENLLVKLNQNYENIEKFLTEILPELPQQSATDSGSALGSAISIAYKLLAPLGGRITVFQSTLPNKGGNDGSVLKNREDPNARALTGSNTQALTPLLNPSTDFYKKLGLKCSENHVGIDLFNFCPAYSDLASISPVARISSGSVFYYGNSGFNMRCSPEKVLARFEADFEHYLCRDIGFEAVMRIRCTRGLSIHTFHGNFFVRSTDLLALPNCNPDAGYAVQISIDEELKDYSNAGFQVAILYTNANGERRIRVSNISLPVVSTINEIISNADQEAVVCLLCKMATDRTLTDNLGNAREALISCAVDILQTFKMLNPMESVNGLTTSHSTALIPLYVSALLKQLAFRVGVSTKIDDRVYALELMKTLPMHNLLTYIYPSLYPLHLDFDYENQCWPAPLQLSFGNIDQNGAYLLDTHDTMVIYVCKAISPEFVRSVFAVDYYSQIPDDGDLFPGDLNNAHNPVQPSTIPKPSAVVPIENYDNPASNRVNALIYHLLTDRPFKPHIFIIREDSRAKYHFLQYMFDDRSESAFSYFEFLQHIQQQIKN